MIWYPRRPAGRTLVEDGSQNGHHTEETPDEHRTGHLQNILDEVLTVLVEETADDDEVEEVVEDVLIALVEVVGARVQRLPRPLVEALSAWIGTDARAYLRTVFADEIGRLGDQTPDSIVRYLSQTDGEYWPED
jgi:hypothetical protein